MCSITPQDLTFGTRITYKTFRRTVMTLSQRASLTSPVGAKPKAIHPPTDRKGKSPKKPEDDETDASSTHQSGDDADTTSLRPSDISEYSTDEND
jgi:hypothetical protein